jgi:glycosyltransferase involved in cell wall biosynthesis
MRILFLSRWFPYPPNNGSKLRIINLLRGLASKHDVDLLSFTDRSVSEDHLLNLRTFCDEIRFVHWSEYNSNSKPALMGMFQTTPRSVIDTFSPEMAQAIRQMMERHSYDLVIASQFDMAAYRQFFKDLPALFEEVEVGVLYARYTNATTIIQRIRNRLTWEKHQRYLKNLLHDFQSCSVVSAQERDLVLDKVTDSINIDIIPNGVRLEEYDHIQPSPEPTTLIFTGPFSYYVNYEAMCWFLEKVFPSVRNKIPDVKLIITGDHAGLPLPAVTNVIQTGFVSDVRPYVANSWASVAPILQGGGTRLKIIESMALRTPVVSTTKGAEGLGVHNGKEILLADTPEEFINAVMQILVDGDLRQEISTNAYRFVQENLDWSVILPRFLKLVNMTVIGTSG